MMDVARYHPVPGSGGHTNAQSPQVAQLTLEDFAGSAVAHFDPVVQTRLHYEASQGDAGRVLKRYHRRVEGGQCDPRPLQVGWGQRYRRPVPRSMTNSPG